MDVKCHELSLYLKLSFKLWTWGGLLALGVQDQRLYYQTASMFFSIAKMGPLVAFLDL